MPWSVSSGEGGSVYPAYPVYHNKVKKFYPKSSGGDKDNPGWQKGYETLYRISELEEINKRVGEIIKIGKGLINEMDNNRFEFF